MTNRKKQTPKGFTLVETMVTMLIFFVIMYGVYIMIQHYGNVTKNEQSRIKMQQESRFMIGSFADELKDAGAVLTLANTGGFLSDEPFFNGLWPLNSTTFPDGIIIATGDPEATTVLTQDYNAGGGTMQTENLTVAGYDPTYPWDTPEWSTGDKGIVLAKDGYYVFSVTEADSSSNILSVRGTPVYYSGLLQLPDYIDDAQGKTAGNAVVYKPGSPVVRLSNFGIYVFREIEHDWAVDKSGNPQKIRQLIRINDTHGLANPLVKGGGGEYSIMSENIWDLQISYVGYEDFATADRKTTIDPAHHFFNGGSTSASVDDLLTDIRAKKLKQINVSIIAIMDDMAGRGNTVINPFLRNIKDRDSADLPPRKLYFRVFSFSVDPRNYNIIL